MKIEGIDTRNLLNGAHNTTLCDCYASVTAAEICSVIKKSM
jgi:hypothetical protein